LLLLAALGGGAGIPSAAAAEAQVATPFEVRKEAQELFDDLAKRGANASAEDGALLERVQQLMARHGDHLVEAPGATGTALPLSEVLWQRLQDLGLANRFQDVYAPLAERRRGEIRNNDAELRALTRSYPGTSAATATWRALADRAWDAGRLGSYLQRAAMAGETQTATPRGQRYAQARALLSVPLSVPPANLDNAQEMWRQPLDLRAVPSRLGNRQLRTEGKGPIARIGLSRPLGDAVCGSDGLRAFVIDHLVGRQQGNLTTVGNSALLRRQCQPAVLRDGFAVVGVKDGQRVVLVALDRDGVMRWREDSPAMGFNPLVSAPVAIDQLVAVALVVTDDDAADLRVQAYRQDNGRLVWDILVARLAGHRPWMFSGDQAFALIPGLAVVDGRLLVLSNSGILARVGADGDLQRVWTYRAPGENVADGLNQQGSVRMGAIVSDGQTAVITPADLPNQALIVNGERSPQTYRGDGANGEVLAVGDGRAFIAGSNRLVAVDVEKRQALWNAVVPGGGAINALNADLQAVLGDKALVIAGREAVAIYDPPSGTLVSQRSLERPVGISAGDQTLIVAADSGDGGGSYVAAQGGAVSVVERLTAVAQSDAKDIRSVVALAAIAAARDQVDIALSWYDEAFKRGAGNEYAQKAAKLLRRRLDLASGEPWLGLLARFEALAARDPSLTLEATYWHARHAESRGDTAAAMAGYTQVAQAPAATPPVVLRDGLALHLRTLAAGGRARLRAGSPLPWSTVASVPLPALDHAWEVAAKRGRGTLVGGGMVIGYADGVLTANRITNGSEAWWRTPQRPLLGVRSRPQQAPMGIPIEIMPGTSAAAAGLLSDDVLLRFNDVEVHSFSSDLVPAVLALTVRSPFTAEVLRGDKNVILHGTLGGEMVEPVTINERSVLVWPTTLGPGQQAVAAALPGTRPEGLWAAVHDLATGVELWRHAIPPATAEESPARPLLTADDLVLLTDGGDLVALPAHPAQPRRAGVELEPLWRLTGQAPALRDARLIDGRMLWLPDLGHDQSQLVDALNGVVLANLPIDSPQAPLLMGADLYARQDDSTLSCWDLGFGRLRWKVPGIARLAAAQGDTIWAVNTTGQMVSLDRYSGTVRRLYGEWVGVIDGRVALASADQGGDRLYLHVTPTATTHALVCLSLAGGAILWQQRLPADIAGIEPTAEGVGCLLAGTRSEGLPPEPAVALAFDRQGAIARVAELAGDPGLAQVRFLPGGLLLAEAAGLRATPATVPEAGKPVASRTAADPAQLNWQTAGSARYALEPASEGHGHLLWVEVGSEDLRVRIGQLGPVVDQDGLLLTFPANPEAAPKLPESLTSEAQSTTEGHRRWRVRIPGVIFPRGGLPWQIRAETASGSDGAAAPWWLRSVWRTVVTPKDGGG
jgi:outer membrane protein assembly factor BamB